MTAPIIAGTLALVAALHGYAPDPIEALFPPHEWDVARCIVHHESRGDVYAVGSAGERSEWQLAPVHAYRFAAHGWDFYRDASDSWKATVIANEVWRANAGWGPWTTRLLCGVRS